MSKAKGAYRPPTHGAKRKFLIAQLKKFKEANRQRQSARPAPPDEPCEKD